MQSSDNMLLQLARNTLNVHGATSNNRLSTDALNALNEWNVAQIGSAYSCVGDWDAESPVVVKVVSPCAESNEKLLSCFDRHGVVVLPNTDSV
jgi:hypothetical protein